MCSCFLLLQFSLWNFVKYNVFGGGDSALYGVESSSFYLRNGFNNLNFILPLALVYPLVAMLDLFQVTGIVVDPCWGNPAPLTKHRLWLHVKKTLSIWVFPLGRFIVGSFLWADSLLAVRLGCSQCV